MTRACVTRFWTNAIVCAAFLGAVAGPGVRAQAQAAVSPDSSSAASKLLLDKAQAAEAHGRMDLAVQAWQQVLLGEPKNAGALGGLARASRAMGDTKLAQSYEQRLHAVEAGAQAPATGAKPLTEEQRAKLTEASQLADGGKYAASLALYHQVFGDTPPAEWAVAYYETEAATDGGRARATEGLRALVAKYPHDDRYQVSLGRVLTYNPATREEGRSYLARFPDDAQAMRALRQSLLWDAANPAVAPQIRAYLAARPDAQLAAVFQATQPAAARAQDAQVAGSGASVAQVAAPAATMPTSPAGTSSAKTGAAGAYGGDSVATHAAALGSAGTPVTAAVVTAPAASVPAATPARPTPAVAVPEATSARSRAAAEVAAYESLNASRIAEAEGRFRTILVADPQDEKALAGMGYVRMQQGNFLGAISFLEQAKRIDAEDKGLTAALDTARFWFVMGEGHDALAANDLRTAEKRYRDALALRPNNAEALEGLGGTLLKAQAAGPAIPLFERAVAAQPASVDGWRGLFMAQFRNDEAALALATFKRIPDAPRAQLMSDPLFLQPLASAYEAVGRQADAQATLEEALKRPFAADQKDVKSDIQIELAGNLSTANQLEQATAIYRQVLAADPGSTASWQGLVRLQHSMGHDEEALATIQSMPAAIYATAMHAPGFEITVASVYESLKKLDVAQDLLQKAVTEETNAGQKPSAAIEMQLAAIYTERGNPQLAYPVYQQVLRENPNRADAWAGLLSALHVTGHDKEAVEQIALVPAGARAQLEHNAAYLQTMAAVYGSVGRPQEATQLLGKVEQDHVAQQSAPPADVEIQKAWSLYNGIDDTGLYQQLMSLGARTDLSADQRKTVQTIWTNWAARRAEQASAVGNPRRALEILNAAARAFPDNPAAIKLLAIGYAQAGQPHQAVLIYKTQNMTSASSADYQGAVASALSDGDNKDAEIWMRYALAAYPADAQVLVLAARFEQARGDTARAIKYYRASLKAMPPPSQGSKLASELALPGPLAPLSLPSAGQPLDLSILLAPGYTEEPATQPSLPNYNKAGPLPPYTGVTQLVPPYMTNPDAAKSVKTVSAAQVSPEVASAVHDASLRAIGKPELGNTPVKIAAARTNGAGSANMREAAGAAALAVGMAAGQTAAGPQTMAASGDVYKPYVAYVSPPVTTGYRGTPTVAVSVALGNDTPHPDRPLADVTDVLPTERYGPSARANQAAASRADVAAARAERIRRLQAEAAIARSGQSHPPAEDTITGEMQPAAYTQSQPPKTPALPTHALGDIPDTGAQQYPQPRTPPPSGETPITPEGAAPPPAIRRAPARAALPAHKAVRTAPVPSHAEARVPARVAVAPTVAAPAAPVSSAAPVESAAADVPAAAVVLSPELHQGNAPVGPAYPLPAPPTDAELKAHDLPALGGAFNGQVPIPQTPREQAERELAALESSYSGWLGVTGIGRYRAGTPGLDRLYDFEAPAEASAVFGRTLRLTAVAEPVFLNSGALNASAFAPGNVPYLGTMVANAGNAPAQGFVYGIGGELQLTSKSVGAAVGYTPYEFLVRNFTGRFLLNALDNHVSLYGDREPVKDTQLSYAGLHDPGTTTPFSQGPIWGGVVASTGGVRVQLGDARASFFLSGEGGILTGQHVVDNYRFKGSLGGMFQVKNWGDTARLTLGAELTGMHYEYDEVGLSYGQGGYFSPYWYASAMVPMKLEGRAGTKFHYSIAGSAGAQAFQQNAALFYPLDPGLQTSLVASKGAACTVALAETYSCGEYPQVSTALFHYTVNSEISYRFNERLYGGVFVFADNSNNYENVSAGFFFRYMFRPQHSTQAYPAGLFRVDGIRPLQIP